MSSNPRPPGADLKERLEAELARTLGRLPDALASASPRMAESMAEHRKALEAARERLRAGAGHTRHRFRP